MTIEINTRKARIAAINAQYPDKLMNIDHEAQGVETPKGLIHLWRSKRFLVQEYAPVKGAIRLSICRTAEDDVRIGSQVDGISWDEIQAIKRQCGYGDWDGVEIYPRDRDVVNVANMRHLWIVEPLEFAWRQK